MKITPLDQVFSFLCLDTVVKLIPRIFIQKAAANLHYFIFIFTMNFIFQIPQFSYAQMPESKQIETNNKSKKSKHRTPKKVKTKKKTVQQKPSPQVEISKIEAPSSTLSEVMDKIGKVPMVEMSTVKVVNNELVGKKTTYTGKIYLTRGKFRWDVEKPESTHLIFDGKVLWIVQDGMTSRTTLNGKAKQQTLVATLFQAKELNRKFNIKELRAEGKKVTYSLRPKLNDLTVKNVEVEVDLEKNELRSLSYNDETDNNTVLTFSNVNKKNKADLKIFNYKPKAGEAVTDI